MACRVPSSRSVIVALLLSAGALHAQPTPTGTPTGTPSRAPAATKDWSDRATRPRQSPRSYGPTPHPVAGLHARCRAIRARITDAVERRRVRGLPTLALGLEEASSDRGASGSTARHVANEVDLTAVWKATTRLRELIGGAAVLPGALLSTTPGGGHVEHWGYLGTTFAC